MITTLTAPGSTLPAYYCQGHGAVCGCYECDETCKPGVRSYCDGTCASAIELLEMDLDAGRVEPFAPSTERITLEIRACDGSASWVAVFEGPSAEAAALAYYGQHKSTHAINEARVAPFSGQAFPALDTLLYPRCEHGGSLDLCEGPNHYMTADQERARYGDW